MREAALFVAHRSDSAPAGLLSEVAAEAGRLVSAWRRRRRLLALSELDDHVLLDIGIRREDLSGALDLPVLADAAGELQRRIARRRESRWASLRR